MISTNQSLRGRTALVTGATSGIGRAAANQLAREGAEVIVHGRDPQRGKEVVAEIVQARGQARFIAADLSDPTEVRRLADEAGEVDVLVNNAGSSWFGPTADLDVATYDALFDSNVRAAYFLVAALAPKMAANGGGSIINISSGAADPTRGAGMPPGYMTYSVAKAALERFSVALALEVADKNIAVNALRPGAVKTEQSVHELGEDYDWSIWKEPSFVVPMVHCLALQRADGLTGRIVDVNSYGATWGCD
jgi:NAD(P)-dependent dehydrogenase (short-subunit alcohol dehydrogenase family)